MLVPFRRSFFPTLIFFPLIVNAALVNVTVDDADPSINYQPGNSWAAEPGCGGCSAKPDPSQMFDRTWHDSTYSADQNTPNPAPVTATFFFTGSAIYVFCALSLGDNANNFSNMTFFIDDELVQNFINPLTPDAKDFDYNVLVFFKTSLTQGTHKFVMLNGGGPSDSLILFDRLVYTQGDDVTTTSTSVSTQHTEASPPGLVSPPTDSQSSENSPPAGLQSAPTTILSTFTTVRSPSTIIQLSSTTFKFSPSITLQPPASALAQSTVTAFQTTEISDTSDSAKSSTSLLASAATDPPEPSARSSKISVTAGAIGGAVGGVFALAIIAFLIRRRRLNTARSEPSLVPFQASEENNPSSPTNASTAQLLSPFNSTPLPKSQSNVRERDAGPVAIARQQEAPLPPDYGEVFSQESDARTETSSSWRPVYSEDSETLKS